jgi:hypothetical protein
MAKTDNVNNSQNSYPTPHQPRNQIPADKWSNTWHIIQQNIDQKLAQEIEIHYSNLNKMDKLQHKQQSNQTSTKGTTNSTPERSTSPR